MSNCDCQENIEDEQSITTVAATADKEPITFGDGLLITTVTSTAAAIFFGLRALGIGQQDALLTSTSLVSFMFLPAIFWSGDKKTLYNKWVVFEDSLRDGLIITIRATGIFFGLKAANVKPPKASLVAMDIIKLAGGICGGLLVKDYAVHKKRINEWYNKNFMTLIGS